MHYIAIQYLKMSQYGRSIRPVTETYNIVIQIYTLSEGCLLSQSTRSGRDALYSYAIFNTSHYGHLLIRSIRPVTKNCNIALPVYRLSRGSLIESINLT
ncbi:hypothetical protein GIB67_003974, partial [Kingdonia uniflora]